jgi:PAS domain S-box-containing protein
MDGKRIRHVRAATPAPGRVRAGAGRRAALFLAAALGCLQPARAAIRVLPVAPDQEVEELQDCVEVLEDAAGRLGIEEVLEPPAADRFRANRPGRELAFGITESAYWLRFRLANQTAARADLLLHIRYPLLDRIDFYAPGREPLILGDTLPFSQRPFLLRHFVIPLTVAAGSTATFHLRVETTGILTVPLEIGSADHVLEQAHGEQLALGLLYGIFAGALLYSLFLWLSIREAVNLYLLGHILSVGLGLACVDGLAFQLWPGWTGWQQWSAHLTAVAIAALNLLFVRSLLASRQRSPRLDRTLRLALWGLLATTTMAAPFGPRVFLRVALAWLILIGALLAVTVFWHARRGHLPARIYAAAWGLFLLLMTAALASGLALLPRFLDFLLLARIGAASEVLLAAIAVAANLRDARLALSASEKKFSRAFRSSPDALTISSLDDGRFIEVNDAFERISGHRREAAIGRTSRELGLWPPGARERFLEDLRRNGSIHRKEGVIIGKDGREIPVQISGDVITLDGRPVLLATTRDISERKLATEQRERLIHELEAKNTELERFTYTASHDLRSPLVTILGYLGILEKDARGGDQERFQGDLDRIRGAANHMRRLLDELLELSRAGRVVSQPQRVPLTEIAEEAATLSRRAIAEAGIELVVSPDLPVVRGDRTRLLQVVRNLLDNAIRFLGDQPAPRIEIGCRWDGEERVCFVRDNGIGIEPRYHEAVFELFRRLQPSVEGTGVGLALARRIVEGHGGTIWVESEGEATGSTFCFVLPAGEEQSGSEPAWVPAPP